VDLRRFWKHLEKERRKKKRNRLSQNTSVAGGGKQRETRKSTRQSDGVVLIFQTLLGTLEKASWRKGGGRNIPEN